MNEMEFLKLCARLNLELANKYTGMKKFHLAMFRIQDAWLALEHLEALLSEADFKIDQREEWEYP